MIKRLVFFGITLAFLGSGCAYGQSLIPTSDLGARNVALGNANMSEAHDISCMYENPAAIVFLQRPSVLLNHTQGNYSAMQENLAFPVVYDRSQMVAFAAQLFSVGELAKSQAGTRYAIGYTLTYARKMTSSISLGGSVSFLRGFVPHQSSASAASYTLGFDYIPNPDVSYGLALGGLGTTVDFVNGGAGVAAIQSISPRVLEGGAEMRFPTESSLRPAYLILALAAEKIIGQSGVDYKGGIEFLPISFLALRLGYIAGPTVHELRYGIGLREGPFAVDFGIYTKKVDESNILFEQVSASMEL